MSLAKIYKHYKITPQKLKELLGANGIDVDLRFVKEVPNEWLPLLTNDTGIEKLEADKRVSPLELVVLKEVKEKGIDPKANLQELKKKLPNETELRLAYVKFVHNDKSHAFVRVIDDLNTIHNERLSDTTVNNYRIDKECAQLDFDQIIIINLHKNKKSADVHTPYFSGFFKINKKRNYNNSYSGNSHFIKSFFVIKNKGFENIIEVRNTKDAIPFEFTTKTLYFQRRSLMVMRVDFKSDSKDYLLQIKEEVIDLLQQEIIDDNSSDTIAFFKQNSSPENFEALLKNQFDNDLSNSSYFIDESTVQLFLNKWLYLNKDWVTITNLENTTFWNYYFKLCLDNKLSSIFWDNKIIAATIKYIEEHEEKNHELLVKNSITYRNKGLFVEPLKSFLESDFIINSFEQLKIIQLVNSAVFQLDANSYNEHINGRLSEELKFKLWIENNSNIFPKEYAISVFNDVDEENQIHIISELESEEIESLIPFVKPNNDNNCQSKLLETSIPTIDNVFKTICFDIETDTKTIYEIAWEENRIKYNYCNENTNEGIEEFKKITLLNKNTLVGHNIVDFDCVELKKYAVEFQNKLIWDTFLIEMLISPELKNFALKTKHISTADVELTLSLFYNQIARIVTSTDNELELLYQYLDNNIIQKINQLKVNNSWNWISKEFINLQKLSFFRPQPNNEDLVINLNDVLKENKGNKNIIIVPENLKKSFYNLENATFYSTTNNKNYGIIDINKVKKLPVSFSWTKVCLENYYNYQISNILTPYWGNIGTAIKIKIEDDLDVFSIVSFKEDFTSKNDKNTIVNCSEFYTIKENLSMIEDIQVYIINKEQILLENKTCIKAVELSELINTNTNNQFWLKFSGGLSYVELNQKDCLNLGIEIPDNFENFWIEKQDYSNFKIWGNFNFEKIIEDFFKNKYSCIDSIDNAIDSNSIYYPKLKIDANANEEFISFNPETNYRSRYWLFQKEIIFQIIETNIPTLLVVQNEKEVSSLELYFRHLEFYIPSNEASLARRMELLHKHKSSKKMMIVAITNFDRTIVANYLDSLNIIIESLKLFENFFIVKNTSLFNNNFDEDFKNNSESSIDDNEDIENENEQNLALEIKKPLFKDIFFHLKLQTPFINYLKNSAFKNNPENKLWILDPRINDYNEISEKWNAKPRSFIVGNELDFENQLSTIEMFINGPKPLKELPFDLERTKEILSDIFLDGKPWYEEQIPYLNDIIPAKTDLLITLPTGGGKSLLFQGPAILRSAFTNKLSIVVTPLKALMQDQVDALWDKGFYGCVEYLNSDRGSDTRIIYRAMAGGEVSLLFVTPERFRSNGFKKALNVRLKTDGGLEYAVFDEAHCVSQWGHEFRPDYFNGAKEINNLKKMASEKFPLLLFSATVSKKIYEDFNTIFS
ncbi:MAG: DEAD/DEAH box helicase [Flavobacterium sp.]|nr:DEAD/DEAH box helicase [Flavobacterium sp.]